MLNLTVKTKFSNLINSTLTPLCNYCGSDCSVMLAQTYKGEDQICRECIQKIEAILNDVMETISPIDFKQFKDLNAFYDEICVIKGYEEDWTDGDHFALYSLVYHFLVGRTDCPDWADSHDVEDTQAPQVVDDGLTQEEIISIISHVKDFSIRCARHGEIELSDKYENIIKKLSKRLGK